MKKLRHCHPMYRQLRLMAASVHLVAVTCISRQFVFYFSRMYAGIRQLLALGIPS